MRTVATVNRVESFEATGNSEDVLELLILKFAMVEFQKLYSLDSCLRDNGVLDRYIR